MGQIRYLFEVGVEMLRGGLVLWEGYQVIIGTQGLRTWLGWNRFLLLVWGRSLIPDGPIAWIAHLLKIMTYLRKGLYKG